jgi:hypothetical protein
MAAMQSIHVPNQHSGADYLVHDYRGLSILRSPLIKKIWVFRKSIAIYFIALARIYLILYFVSIYLISIYL